jgi:hypothetical protein
VGSYNVLVSNLVGMVTNTIALVDAQLPLSLALDGTAQPPSYRVTAAQTRARSCN